jgi:hypothetical protein
VILPIFENFWKRVENPFQSRLGAAVKMIKMVIKCFYDLKTATNVTKASLNFESATDVTKASLNFKSATDVTKASLNQNHVSSKVYVFQTRIYLAMDVTKAFFINMIFRLYHIGPKQYFQNN